MHNDLPVSNGFFSNKVGWCIAQLNFFWFFGEVVIRFKQARLSCSFGEYLNKIAKVVKETLGLGRYIRLNTALSCC